MVIKDFISIFEGKLIKLITKWTLRYTFDIKVF